MELLFAQKKIGMILLGIFAVFLVGFFGKTYLFPAKDMRETATVTRGTVSQIVSVSGTVRTPNTATLGFPTTGVISDISVKEGDLVKKGQVLATLKQSGPLAEYNDALAGLTNAEATRAELIAGPRQEARTLTDAAINNAEAELARVTKKQDEIIENALHTLYSSDLAAKPVQGTNNDDVPLVTGTYTCTKAQTYRFVVYPSNAYSGYSYKVLEGDALITENAVAETAQPFGSCGLFIQFVMGARYNRGEWQISIPNTEGASYTANQNAYTLAQKERENVIARAKDDLDLARKEATLDNAAPRAEALSRASADIAKAQAKLKAAEARIADFTIRAPFDGIVSAVDIVPGEINNASKGIIMTANDTYELKIRIPEIEITHIKVGNTAVASFDAKAEELIPATISFISPLPTLIDGVSYFEAFLTINTIPPWMRTGLNADVDITTAATPNTLMLPKRFIKTDGNVHAVLIIENGKEVEKNIELGIAGNDGFVEVQGVPEGTVVIAP